jgi:hypothetical protein
MSRLLCLLTLIGFAALAGAPRALAQAEPVPRDLVDYVFSDDAQLEPGAVYTVTGTLVVPEGVVVTFPPSVELRFNRGAGLDIHGQVVVEPGDTGRALLTTLTRIPGWWRGVRLLNPSGEVRSLSIEYAEIGVDLSLAEGALVIDCEVLEFGTSGIRVTPEDPDRPSFHMLDTILIENIPGRSSGRTPRGAGVDAQAAGALFAVNIRIGGAERGLRVGGASEPVVLSSIFENNTVGIEVTSSAAPVIAGASFWSNGTAVRFTPDTIVGGFLTLSSFDDNGINLDLRAVAPGQPAEYDARSNDWYANTEAETLDQIERSILDFAEEPLAPKAAILPLLP